MSTSGRGILSRANRNAGHQSGAQSVEGRAEAAVNLLDGREQATGYQRGNGDQNSGVRHPLGETDMGQGSKYQDAVVAGKHPRDLISMR
ncbi:MAG: hypothetical protein DMG70_16360 [Acidobacteria bacterium]|nr:MAG: hypothetical protein DMG70_16360 [Acidobacteriota bacterium]PYY05571.1 MAG: hypothetical protein DMG69_26290 [Acidobacteriota bacterium]